MLVGRQKFGRVEILPAQRRLLVDGREQALGARAFDMLLVLVEHRDRIVAKDELLDRVWPGMVVEENNLPVQVSALRKLLGPQAIATIPGRGYRFTLVDEAEPPAADAPVAPVAATAPASPAADEASDITLPAERPPAPRLDLP
jgi:DNA-binding winged helix-turn-helix (wHTH) protein